MQIVSTALYPQKSASSCNFLYSEFIFVQNSFVKIFGDSVCLDLDPVSVWLQALDKNGTACAALFPGCFLINAAYHIYTVQSWWSISLFKACLKFSGIASEKFSNDFTWSKIKNIDISFSKLVS